MSNLLTLALSAFALLSPNGKIEVRIETGNAVVYSVKSEGEQIIAPSPISMTLSDGSVYGGNARAGRAIRKSIDEVLTTPLYKKSSVKDRCNELVLPFKTFNLVFRAYDEGVAYRFVSKSRTPFKVVSEQATFAFPQERNAWVPFVRGSEKKTMQEQFFNSFENLYTYCGIEEWNKNRMAFLPVLVDAPKGKKVCIAESALSHYPGMYLCHTGNDATLSASFAPVPNEVLQGGHNNLQGLVRSSLNYIAEARSGAAFPWRVIVISENDRDLLDSDLVYILGNRPDGRDWSWVKPGKVAWDWWNDWNLYGVDFETGVNDRTYEYYIDFASKYGIEYVILDEGWAVNKKADLFQVVPEIHLEHLVSYASQRNVGLILWAGYWAVNRDIEGVCKHFSEMGIKGFKVDFMNRDDQQMVDFYEELAATAAKYHLIIDFHGAFKPAGINRAWPNVLNFEGVFGLEQMKFAGNSGVDQVSYDVTFPFIRLVAGPADYTQGAMRNATRRNYHPVNNEPMSQGTRCRQLAEYMVFDAPLTMMCDSPTAYEAEKECTAFISGIPVVWDDTRALAGEVGKYICVARRSADKWYVGMMTDWSARDMEIDFGFLPEGEYTVTLFRDGVNAGKIARDYCKETLTVKSTDKKTIHLAPGGGAAMSITRK